MSTPEGFGTPPEWGLTPQRHRELCAELSDHLASLAEGEAPREAADAKLQIEAQSRAEAEAARLAQPAVRRRLTAVHLADQVCATLHRRPSRAEWRELGWLGFWFVLILVSDVLAAWTVGTIVERQASAHWSPALLFEGYRPYPVSEVWASFASWLLMGFARAGFFASFAISLRRAWQTGWGVCLGRIIQLKLIHTVLVVIALASIGTLIEKYAWGGYSELYVQTALPAWLSSPLVCSVLALAGAAVWLARRRAWGIGFFLLLSAFFLYPGGPAPLRGRIYENSILGRMSVLSDGRRVTHNQAMRMDLAAAGLKVLGNSEPNAQEIAAKAQTMRAWDAKGQEEGSESALLDLDEANNRVSMRFYEPVPMPWHITAWVDDFSGWRPRDPETRRHRQKAQVDSSGRLHLLAPNAVPGGGVGWLAAPIPLLTLVGLCGLVGLMGRRSQTHLLLYLLLAGLAMGTTLMPFFVGQPQNNLMTWGPMAIMHTPFPGFETLLVTPLTYSSLSGPGMTEFAWTGITLVLGLLLSAAIPWLMTALFLKPKTGARLPKDLEAA